jgi:hypothetical protein
MTEAAKEMNLSEQRIHQLLAGGDLDGVETACRPQPSHPWGTQGVRPQCRAAAA